MHGDELFPLDAVFMESPRLRWMKLHEIRTTRSDMGFDGYDWAAWQAKDEPEPGGVPTAYFEGHSEDDAIQELALARGLALWNVKGWE